jgi:hypothetical protein
MGHVLFKNMTLLENRLGGVAVIITNQTTSDLPLILEDLLIIGHSNDNDHGMDIVHSDQKQAGIVLPRSEEILIKNVVFANFEKK